MQRSVLEILVVVLEFRLQIPPCAMLPIEQFVHSKSQAAHKRPRNGAELQDCFPVSFSGLCYVVTIIHCAIAPIVHNAHCAFRDCVYMLF